MSQIKEKIQTGKPNEAILSLNPKLYVLEAIPDEKALAELTSYAIDYCHSIGHVALWAERKECTDISVTPPIALLPSAFPAELYEKANAVQPILNELYFRIAMDHDFLVEAFKDVVKTDKWIAKQIEMMELVRAEGLPHQNKKLCLQFARADYMPHWDEHERKMELKQVEVNIGQVGGPGLASAMAKLHKRMLAKAEALHCGGKFGALLEKATKLEENCPSRKMAEAMFQAWKLFGDSNAVVVFLNQTDLFPVAYFEQLQFVQFNLEEIARMEGHHLNVVRLSIAECPERMHLDADMDFSLYVDGNKRVAIVHMAYGYLPEHFPTENEWKSRVDMERSTAIISPNIRCQLAGSKKIQQILAMPDVIERFLPSESPVKIAELRATFTGLWGLENDDAIIRAIIAEAIGKPGNFVMKAQLGAGKGNYFDEEMAKMLQEMSVEQRGAYILQQKIQPVVTKNYLKHPFAAPILENVVSELGIYGTLLGMEEEGGKVLWNRVEGYLVRSKPICNLLQNDAKIIQNWIIIKHEGKKTRKPHRVNQGGICEGGGVLDSALLFPEAEMH